MIPKFRCFDKDTKTMHEVTIEGYNVVRYEQCNTERTYILVSYEENEDD